MILPKSESNLFQKYMTIPRQRIVNTKYIIRKPINNSANWIFIKECHFAKYKALVEFIEQSFATQKSTNTIEKCSERSHTHIEANKEQECFRESPKYIIDIFKE